MCTEIKTIPGLRPKNSDHDHSKASWWSNEVYDAGNPATVPYSVAKTKTLLQQFQTEVAQGLTFNASIYLPTARVIKSTLLVIDVEVYAEKVPLLNLYQPHDAAIVYFSPVETSLRSNFLGNTELATISLKDHATPQAKTWLRRKAKSGPWTRVPLLLPVVR